MLLDHRVAPAGICIIRECTLRGRPSTSKQVLAPGGPDLLFIRWILRILPESVRIRIWARRARSLSGKRYWDERALFFGPRAVLNLSHSEAEMADLTSLQERTILAAVERYLPAGAARVLDFGCGPGRFAPMWLRIFAGTVILMDPVFLLLSLIPTHPRALRLQVSGPTVPLQTGSLDVVWVCLVLGGIAEEAVSETCAELERSLADGGLLILIENTAALPSSRHWQFRGVSDYQTLFPRVALTQVGGYTDSGKTISIMAGLKSAGRQAGSL